MKLTQSSQEFTRDFGDQLAKAEAHLRSALGMLHQQQDASEHFSVDSLAVLQKWAADVADLAESVRRQV